MSERYDWTSYVVQLTSAIIIAAGLPAGLYLMIESLSFENASVEIGRGFMRGLQSGINETALEALVRKLSQSAVMGIPGTSFLRHQ